MAFFEMVIQSVPTCLNILVSENQWYVMGGGGIILDTKAFNSAFF